MGLHVCAFVCVFVFVHLCMGVFASRRVCAFARVCVSILACLCAVFFVYVYVYVCMFSREGTNNCFIFVNALMKV